MASYQLLTFVFGSEGGRLNTVVGGVICPTSKFERLLFASLVSLKSVVSAMSDVSESVPPVDMADSIESRTTGRNVPNTDAAAGGVLDKTGTTRGVTSSVPEARNGNPSLC